MVLEKALESIKAIKLKGGIFEKTTTLLIVLCICVAAVCISIRMWQIALGLMIPLMFMVFYTLKKCIDFAERNPYAAIMDGAELLVHEKIVHGQKGQSEIPILESTIDHELPKIDHKEVLEEDPPVTEEPDDATSSKQEGGE